MGSGLHCGDGQRYCIIGGKSIEWGFHQYQARRSNGSDQRGCGGEEPTTQAARNAWAQRVIGVTGIRWALSNTRTNKTLCLGVVIRQQATLQRCNGHANVSMDSDIVEFRLQLGFARSTHPSMMASQLQVTSDRGTRSIGKGSCKRSDIPILPNGKHTRRYQLWVHIVVVFALIPFMKCTRKQDNSLASPFLRSTRGVHFSAFWRCKSPSILMSVEGPPEIQSEKASTPGRKGHPLGK